MNTLRVKILGPLDLPILNYKPLTNFAVFFGNQISTKAYMDPKAVLHLLNKILPDSSWSITLNKQLSPFLAENITFSCRNTFCPILIFPECVVHVPTNIYPKIHPHPPHQNYLHQLQHLCLWRISTAPQTGCLGRRNVGKVSALARCEDFVHFANTCHFSGERFRAEPCFWCFFWMFEAKEPLGMKMFPFFSFSIGSEKKVLWINGLLSC